MAPDVATAASLPRHRGIAASRHRAVGRTGGMGQKERARCLHIEPLRLVPVKRVELPTFALRMRCSTN